MSKRKNKRLQSTGKGTNSGSVSQPLPSSNSTSLSKYYQHISKLPLHKFIDVAVDDNLYALVISGDPTKEQLLEAWQGIALQYADAIKDHESKLFFSIEKELHILRATYAQILTLIDLLSKVYAKQFADMLNELLKVNFKFDYTDPEKYQHELKRCFNRSKGVKLEIQKQQIAYDKMAAKFEDNGSKKPTREYYYGILITLSDSAGYEIHEDITVYAFCERIRRLNRQNDMIKNKTHGKRK